MDIDHVDLCSDESISNIPLANFNSPPKNATKTSKRKKGPPPAASSVSSGRILRSSTKPFKRELLKKKYNEKLKKLKKEKPVEEQPETPVETVNEPEKIEKEIVTNTVKPKVPPAKEPEKIEKEVVTNTVKPKVPPAKEPEKIEKEIVTNTVKPKVPPAKEPEKIEKEIVTNTVKPKVPPAKEPEKIEKEIVTNTVKPKVPPAKAIKILEDVRVTTRYKLIKSPVKLSIDIDPELQDKWYLSGLKAEAGAQLRVRPDPALRGTGLLLWVNSGASRLTSVHGNLEVTPPEVRCSQGLYVCEMEDATNRVREGTLIAHVTLMEAIACCKLTVVLFGYKEYFRTACKRYKVVTEFDIETAIVDLIVSINCDAIVINEPSELIMTLMQFHKGLKSLYKTETCSEEAKADFYMKGFNKKCVGVGKDGEGLARMWQKMLSILPKSSLETARALCAQYRSPRALYECLTTEMGLESVSEVAVYRSWGPKTRSRRVGFQLARKLKTLFTDEDGSTVVM